ncbi:MAG: DnaD domain protein [Anaerolineae bacterium]|nr:DnaD domain protein [Anaerolineae bacterium]
MRTFSGFQPGKVHTVRLPEPVFSELIPLIDDLDELKVTLHVLYRLGQVEGTAPYLRHADLRDDALLLPDAPQRGTALKTALDRAVERGTLLRIQADVDGLPETVYMANSPRGRAALEALRRGEPLAEASTALPRPSAFVLYEQNIGPLTPLLADELKEAEARYPAAWIEAAFREAVILNKRSWKYIRAILERWHTEGKGDREDQDDEEDRGRYIKGKYAEFIKY